MKDTTIAPLALFVLFGCASLPPAPALRSDTQVNGSFGKTWDAVVDYFARSSIPVKTIDRSSGLIAAEATRMAGDNSRFATCNILGLRNVAPEGGTFNVIIHGDSTRSMIRVTANWIGLDGKGDRIDCVSHDTFEQEFEAAIKAKVETR